MNRREMLKVVSASVIVPSLADAAPGEKEADPRIYGIWASRKDNNEVCFGIDACNLDLSGKLIHKAHDGLKVFVAKPPIFKERQLFATDLPSDAMCTVSDDMATDLMGFLWDIGIRPRR